MLAYADRSRIIPDEHRAQVIRRNGDCLPTVLVDGHVAGVWRLSADPGPSLELRMFDRPPDDEAVAGALVEAERLQQLVAPRDPDLYGRFRRWWPQLDGHTVRVPLDGAS